MSWEKGRDVIEDLLDRGHLERVPANASLRTRPCERVPANEAAVAHLVARARAHLGTAAGLADDDPEIAYDALYAAARKAHRAAGARSDEITAARAESASGSAR